ncbi:MAG TPA: acyl-protein synthetase [Thermoanaerobaculia bacterium]|nr:acyl-protein synthetase [Thermoanaerobaculia bacterium]
MQELAERIAAFVRDPAEGDFDELAAAAFRLQFERVEPFRRLCAARGIEPGGDFDWRRVPAVPTSAFRSLPVTVAAGGESQGVETFRSSGTTGGEAARSVHVHPFSDLYRATIDAAFPRFCLPRAGGWPPMLALVPRREERPDSSLSFMVDHVVRRWGGEASAWGLGPRGVDARAARSWLGARQREGRPAMVLATAFALADLVDGLARLDLRFRLPPGSVVFETGGFKGRERETSPAELAAGVAERLGVPAGAIAREYGMTELTSQLYTRALSGGDPGLYVAPHQVRVRVVDPETLAERPAGRTGLVAIFDLANLSSAIHLLTEDLGRLEDGGLRLLGRAPGAELRGCSLTVEELAGA